MSKLQAPFRVDHVGSFLRPKELVEAKRKNLQKVKLHARN